MSRPCRPLCALRGLWLTFHESQAKRRMAQSVRLITRPANAGDDSICISCAAAAATSVSIATPKRKLALEQSSLLFGQQSKTGERASERAGSSLLLSSREPINLALGLCCSAARPDRAGGLRLYARLPPADRRPTPVDESEWRVSPAHLNPAGGPYLGGALAKADSHASFNATRTACWFS
jgi:hypothetical protein